LAAEPVARLRSRGPHLLVSSHILAEVAQTVDSVVILDRGHLVAQSTMEELTAGAHQRVAARDMVHSPHGDWQTQRNRGGVGRLEANDVSRDAVGSQDRGVTE
jgi:ABC-type multidrug transport system ATPase subunit